MNDIIIYPSSWYYNACVQGFLEVLAWGLGDKGPQIVEEQLLQDDGRVIIPGDLAEAIFGDNNVPMPAGFNCIPVPKELAGTKRIVWWWVGNYQKQRGSNGKEKSILEELVKSTCNSLMGSNVTDYSGLFPWNKKGSRLDFLNNWFSLTNKEVDGISCSFCGTKYISEFKDRLEGEFFTLSMSKWLGNSLSKFPNLFWNCQPNLVVCKTCRSFFLCFHLIHNKRFFINSNSFLVNWYLNRLLAGTSLKRQALLNALHYDPQLRRGISSWGLQNMEVLIFQNVKDSTGKTVEILNYYPLPARLAKLFLIPRLSSLIAKVSDERVWDLILSERFDYLPIVIYKSLRAYITGKQHDKDPDIINRGEQNKEVQPIVNLIEFYNELKRYLEKEKGGKGVAFVNVKELRELAIKAPLKLNDGLVFRLLELTRLNRKADVYHILLRLYVAENIAFPTPLSELFMIRDNELFKNSIYAFISGLKSDDENEKGGNVNEN